MKTVADTFKQFCKERHAEDKKRNYDTLQEIYASTELFDLSLLEFEGEVLHGFSKVLNEYVGTFPYQDINLPFQNCFLKLKEDIYLFLREYSPKVITGTMYMTNYMYEMPEYANITGTLNVPFTIRIEDGVILSNTEIPLLKEYMKVLMENIFKVVIQVCDTLNNLSKKSVATDTLYFIDYYRRKNAPTIKVSNRPIYYVLGNKSDKEIDVKFRSINPKGKLEYSSAFKVRGHWRRINEKSLGKDRNGNYGVHGYTWVTEYIKGEGELSKRLRVVK